MAPDVEELIKRINSLTLDKSRLKLRLMLSTDGNGKSSDSQNSDSSGPVSQQINDMQSNDSKHREPDSYNPESGDIGSQSSLNKTIAGVECATSCEDDILYINNLLTKRIEEYDSKWILLQSKCSALSSEMNALQRHYAIIKREKMELCGALKMKCDAYDKLRGELQTVVLNYETQLGAMSEHLSTITSQMTKENDSETI